MNITIVAVGKLKEYFWKDACKEYIKRLGAYARVKVCELADVDPQRAGGVSVALDREGDAVCATLPKRAHVVLLALEGNERTSLGISQRIDKLALAGINDLVFVIGGSYGVSEAVQHRADELLSFGRITLPHNLARVVLLEQLYRAFKILHGEPYHK